METQTTLNTGFSSILDTNKSDMAKIADYKKSKITTTPRNIAFASIIGLGGIMSIMFATQIITGMFAIILTAAVGVGGFYSIRFMKAMDPLIQQKTKNRILEKMFEEVRQNSVAQLDNQVITNSKRLETARKSRDRIGGLVAKMRSKIDPKNVGTTNYEKKLATVTKIEVAYDLMSQNLTKAAGANKDFQRKVIEYKDMNAFADIAGEALAMLSSSSNKDLEDMLSLEAFDNIETDFNSAIIGIENGAKDYALDQDL